jgi:hypothetical protein
MEIYFLGMKPADKERVKDNPWIAYLDGKNPRYAETMLRRDLERIRQRVQGMRQDPTTPDTRLADDPLKFNPASVTSLIRLVLGGLPPENHGGLLHCRLRYFDPQKRRAGLPEDVAVLIEKMDADSVTATFVNTSPVKARTVAVQGGAYAEHQILAASINGKSTEIDRPAFRLRLAPGSGGRLVLTMKRFANQPTLAFPF